MKFSILAGLIALCGRVYAADWAVLVAGSNYYYNYRHQADIYHAYHIVREFGIPQERIIVMHYDDIASDPSNPFPGQVFNKPTGADPGVNVYVDIPKDYTGKDVTPANFINVLTGNSTAAGGKKVLKSKKDDRVFINFSDHGATGLIAFPTGELSATQLNDALKTMHKNDMYSKLVFYLEACESGSMFEGLLPENMNIYVTTASNAEESSWGTYCPPDDTVGGKSIGSCLGDLYSVNWMENADAVGKTETLQDQFEIVQKTTTQSHVMQYGQLDWTSDPIGDFLGDTESRTYNFPKAPEHKPNPAGIVNSRDIPLHVAYYQYLRADKTDFEGRLALAKTLQLQITSRLRADLIFHELASKLDSRDLFFAKAAKGFKCGVCCDVAHQAVRTECGGYDDYSLQYARVIHNLCKKHDASTIVSQLTETCRSTVV